MAKVKLDKNGLQKTNNEFYTQYPDRKTRPLTKGPADTKLRAEWLVVYKKYVNSVSVKQKLKNITKFVCKRTAQYKKVYVYIYVAAAGGHGHVGLVLEQGNGSYVRYSQAAENPNLQGWDRAEYLSWMQKVVVRKKDFPKNTKIRKFAPGSKITQIPTKFPDVIQKAVDEYIADKTYYHLVTNNCADFVNDAINKAEDVDVQDKTIPTEYYAQFKVKFPGCEV